MDVNIDTVKFVIPGVTRNGKSFKLPKTYARIETPDGKTVRYRSNRYPIRGKTANHKLHVRNDLSNNELEIEGALFAALHGQNVHTTDDLRLLIFKTIKHVRSELSFDVTAKEQWRAGEIELHRVDIAVNYQFDSKEEVLKVLRQIGIQLASQNGKMSSRRMSIRYEPRNGMYYAINFYDKGSEMTTHAKRLSEEDYQRLADSCDGVLRIELRLNHSELTYLGLNRLHAWHKKTASNLFNKYLGRVPLLDVTFGAVNKDELDKLPKGLRVPMALHKAGIKLEEVYTKGHVKRVRTKARQEGIDLRVANQPVKSMSLKDLFCEERLAKRPDWLGNRK